MLLHPSRLFQHNVRHTRGTRLGWAEKCLLPPPGSSDGQFEFNFMCQTVDHINIYSGDLVGFGFNSSPALGRFEQTF